MSGLPTDKPLKTTFSYLGRTGCLFTAKVRPIYAKILSSESPRLARRNYSTMGGKEPMFSGPMFVLLTVLTELEVICHAAW
jgi:hypothetical protein